MSEPANNPPTVGEVAEMLQRLIVGSVSRQEASDWAGLWITRFTEIQFDRDRAADRKIKKALDRLGGANSPSTDREYLYEQVDFRRWLAELLV